MARIFNWLAFFEVNSVDLRDYTQGVPQINDPPVSVATHSGGDGGTKTGSSLRDQSLSVALFNDDASSHVVRTTIEDLQGTDVTVKLQYGKYTLPGVTPTIPATYGTGEADWPLYVMTCHIETGAVIPAGSSGDASIWMMEWKIQGRYVKHTSGTG